ncbi:septum formation family protein [Gulosibacter molinativorax]|uniref:Septum formation-related domain-containing protein n=1 Tax=Gulosibacter molinativorax TaxID=256821 RepID=A0ABT7C3X7_9MICO|nr:septum formation family protein [Gulosibacter molinativorax]MDJ1369938.1 hypothetical protein [Gulosibacter molinativorax]QUY61908.1 Hypotetical protein [Gulosibacter molinativorax]
MKKSLLAPCILATALVLTGCAANDEGTRTVPLFDAEVGECFTTDDEQTTAFVAPCEVEHTYEVAEAHLVEGETYPGDEAIQQQADRVCPEAFLAYTDEPAAASTTWTSMAFAPGEAGWTESNNHSILCVVTPLNGEQATGSAKQ